MGCFENLFKKGQRELVKVVEKGLVWKEKYLKGFFIRERERERIIYREIEKNCMLKIFINKMKDKYQVMNNIFLEIW